MRRPSAALVVASAALVMSTIGTSVAATHFVISSPRQIKPGTITLNALTKGAKKALRGQRGARGPAGPAVHRSGGSDGGAGTVGDEALGADRSRRERERLEWRRHREGGRVAGHLRGQLRAGHHALRGDGDAGRDSHVRRGRIDRRWPRRRPAPARLQRGTSTSPRGTPR